MLQAWSSDHNDKFQISAKMFCLFLPLSSCQSPQDHRPSPSHAPSPPPSSPLSLSWPLSHTVWLTWKLKVSMERSLLPSAIFLILTRNRPWKSEDYLCTLFFIEMSKENSKKAREYRQFRGVLGRWRTAAIDRTTFHGCQRCQKTAVFAAFSRLRGVIWRVKAFHDQQCQFLPRNKSLSSENESNCSMTSECVRTDSILPRGASRKHGRCKQSIFSISIFGILVERLSF